MIVVVNVILSMGSRSIASDRCVVVQLDVQQSVVDQQVFSRLSVAYEARSTLETALIHVNIKQYQLTCRRMIVCRLCTHIASAFVPSGSGLGLVDILK